jgi:hypothetical protein
MFRITALSGLLETHLSLTEIMLVQPSYAMAGSQHLFL